MTVLSPATIAGDYFAAEAAFGPGVAIPVTGNLVLIEDDVAPTTDGCEIIQNEADLAGKIVVIDRGLCTFIAKANTAAAAGAIAMIVVNNSGAEPISMGGAGTDVAIETADVALLSGNLSTIPQVIRLARATMQTIRFNVALALIAKLVFLVLVVTGHANLVMAIAADSGVAILVILLSLRLFTR